jgi:putative transposase
VGFSGMARKPREAVADGIFHVYARGDDKRLIYRDDVDRTTYVRMLAEAVERCGWRLLAFCLMENHVHLLIETPKANLGVGMQRLHGEYAHYFNLRHGHCGHVFQGRYGSKRIRSDGQLWMVAAYLARNPVDAGLCADPGEWPWSSHADTVAGTSPSWLDAARLLDYFAASGGDARTRYVAICDRTRESPAGAGLSGGGTRLVGAPRGVSGAPSR